MGTSRDAWTALARVLGVEWVNRTVRGMTRLRMQGAVRRQSRPVRGLTIMPFLLMAPALVLVAVVAVYPIVEAGKWSLHDTSYLQMAEYVGLSHYVELLHEARFWANIRASVTYVAGSLVLVVPFSTYLALLLSRPMPGRRVVRTLLIMPWVASQTVAGMLWKWLVNADFGPVSYLYELVTGGTMDNPLGTRVGAMLVLILANVWLYYPFAMVLILAALQTVPEEVYDAALIDGASPSKTWWSITLPIIRPTVAVTLVLLTLEFFNMVTLGYTLTGGGPFSSTELVSVRTFKEAFEFWHMGQASALAVLLFVANGLFGIAYVRLLRTGA